MEKTLHLVLVGEVGAVLSAFFLKHLLWVGSRVIEGTADGLIEAVL